MIATILAIILVAGVVLAMARTGPAAPVVNRQNVLVDTVRQGPLVFKVRAGGTLQPVDVRILTAQTACTVSRILVQPGSPVTSKTVIAEFSSPETLQAAQDAMWNFRKAEAEFKVGLINQKTAVDTARRRAQSAMAKLEISKRLLQEKLLPQLDFTVAEVVAKDADGQLASEQAKWELYRSRPGAPAPASADMERARALWDLKRAQADSLHLVAGMDGVLQELPLQVGQQVAPGATLAKVARPLPLKAVLKVNETQAKDVLIGQPVEIDTGNGTMTGQVTRVDPVVMNGTVTVDAGLDGDFPKGSRPDLNVDGTVEIGRMADATYVGLPAGIRPRGIAEVFRLSPDGNEASRVRVTFGRGSAATIEVVDGLKPGDRVILSDISPWDGADRVRLK